MDDVASGLDGDVSLGPPWSLLGGIVQSWFLQVRVFRTQPGITPRRLRGSSVADDVVAAK